MKIKKILVPIDGTERSMHSLDYIKEVYEPEQVQISIINVKEVVFVDGISISDEIKNSEKFGRELLEKARKVMDGYDVNLYFTFGYAGDEIVRRAKDEKVDMIVMTKSTKKGLTRMLGSNTAYVLKHANCTVTIIPE
ncbi:universal stress protein [Peptostreptococcus faecalis]|uniref:universal stress protein n=1 Tax=Peptostreptococcus faecalis TaxID=2045015 RepID=UPI000C7B3B5D|nr:universal stress protein [Peptostreptococcus faecalis]